MKRQVIINKTKYIIVFILFLFAHYESSCQCVIEEKTFVILGLNSQETNYIEYIVRNNTQDTMYIWIDTNTVETDSLDMEQKDSWLFLKYIRVPKCEIGLEFLCHDNSINFCDVFPPPPVIGCTFIKKIIPDESFVIIALNRSIGKDTIHCVKKELVSHFFKIERLDVFCYENSYVLVM